jgi:hypothetical protein
LDEKEFEAMEKEFKTKEIEIIIGDNILDEDILIFDGRKYKIEDMSYTDGNLEKIKVTPIMTDKEFADWLKYKRLKYKSKLKGITK